MKSSTQNGLIAAGVSFVVGMLILGFFLKSSVQTFRSFDRTVTVRGLAEQEHLADVVIWPIAFTMASNIQEDIYRHIERNTLLVVNFLRDRGVDESEISVDVPTVTDRSAQRWGGDVGSGFRYVATQSVTVYSNRVEEIRDVMREIGDLGKQGVIVGSDDYQFQIEYLFTRLNDIKPEMIEVATIEARKVAEKFAEDSDSRLGKIKTASQGQFSISDRDRNNPHIKNVRVVSTIEYYLVD